LPFKAVLDEGKEIREKPSSRRRRADERELKKKQKKIVTREEGTLVCLCDKKKELLGPR